MDIFHPPLSPSALCSSLPLPLCPVLIPFLLLPLPPFQNTREAAQAIAKMPLAAAKTYMEAVLNHTRAIPFRRYCGGVGRTGQVKAVHSNGQGRWPVKSAQFLLTLLKNAESNAEVGRRGAGGMGWDGMGWEEACGSRESVEDVVVLVGKQISGWKHTCACTPWVHSCFVHVKPLTPE